MEDSQPADSPETFVNARGETVRRHSPRLGERVPQPHGGSLVYGAGAGRNPGSGRPSNDWRARMRKLRDDALRAAETQRVLSDPSNPLWLPAFRFLHEAAEGKPAQAVDVTSKGEALGHLTDAERTARVAQLLAVLQARAVTTPESVPALPPAEGGDLPAGGAGEE